MKKLNLNRDIYHNYITNELSKTYQISIDNKPNNLKICKFLKTGEKPSQLNIYENSDGTTTLQYQVGQNQALSQIIAEEIVSLSGNKEFKSHSFYIKAIRDEDFEALLEIILEYGNTIEDDQTDGKKRIIKIRGKQGDKITLTKHSNNAFQVQGKPMLLFSEVIEILSEFMAFDEIISQQLEFYETNLTTADIKGELEAKLPNMFPFLEDKLKVIITPSIALQKTDLKLDDYSAFAYPILRAVEGVLKQILIRFGKVIDYKEGFGVYIVKDGMGGYILEQDFRNEVNNTTIGTIICKLYKYYNIHRHSLFHIDNTIVTSKVISLQEANNIIANSLTIIDESYVCLS